MIPLIELPRADGVSVLELPGISLLDRHVFDRFAEESYRDSVREVLAEPIAELLDRTRSTTDLVPLFTLHPGWATRRLRHHFRSLGHELPIEGGGDDRS